MIPPPLLMRGVAGAGPGPPACPVAAVPGVAGVPAPGSCFTRTRAGPAPAPAPEVRVKLVIRTAPPSRVSIPMARRRGAAARSTSSVPGMTLL
jgi:hypothetical protein